MPQKRPLVAVYCSSCGDLPGEVTLGAQQIAAAIGQCGADLVYGGVNAGLMHTVAQAAQLAATAAGPYARGRRVDRSHIHPTPAALIAHLKSLLP